MHSTTVILPVLVLFVARTTQAQKTVEETRKTATIVDDIQQPDDVYQPLPKMKPEARCGLGDGPARSKPKRMCRGTNLRGSNDANPNAWPWHVAIASYNTSWTHCGGTLVSRHVVLTAAHCVAGNSNTNVHGYCALAGVHDLTDTSDKECKVADRVVSHPKFDADTAENDIAALYFKEPFDYNSRIRPICLPKEEAPTGDTFYETGWGLKEGSYSSLTLRETPIRTLSDRRCEDYYLDHSTNEPYQNNSMLCTCKQPCDTDSGGPLMYKNSAGRWELHGISSWGFDNCWSHYHNHDPHPGVFTKILAVMDFITGTD